MRENYYYETNTGREALIKRLEHFLKHYILIKRM